MNRTIASLTLAAGLVLGGAGTAMAEGSPDSYIPPPTNEVVLPGPTYTPPAGSVPAQTVAPVQQDHLAATGGPDWAILAWVAGAILIGGGLVHFSNQRARRDMDD